MELDPRTSFKPSAEERLGSIAWLAGALFTIACGAVVYYGRSGFWLIPAIGVPAAIVLRKSIYAESAPAHAAAVGLQLGYLIWLLFQKTWLEAFANGAVVAWIMLRPSSMSAWALIGVHSFGLIGAVVWLFQHRLFSAEHRLAAVLIFSHLLLIGAGVALYQAFREGLDEAESTAAAKVLGVFGVVALAVIATIPAYRKLRPSMPGREYRIEAKVVEQRGERRQAEVQGRCASMSRGPEQDQCSYDLALEREEMALCMAIDDDQKVAACEAEMTVRLQRIPEQPERCPPGDDQCLFTRIKTRNLVNNSKLLKLQVDACNPIASPDLRRQCVRTLASRDPLACEHSNTEKRTDCYRSVFSKSRPAFAFDCNSIPEEKDRGLCFAHNIFRTKRIEDCKNASAETEAYCRMHYATESYNRHLCGTIVLEDVRKLCDDKRSGR
jgi:hypothetical protein